MPEIVRCPECHEETYRGLALCPHCGGRLPPGLSLDARPPRDDGREPRNFVERVAVILVLAVVGLFVKTCTLG